MNYKMRDVLNVIPKQYLSGQDAVDVRLYTRYEEQFLIWML